MENKSELQARKIARTQTRLSFEGVKSQTKQHFAKGTRIDQILKKYSTLGPETANVFAQLTARMTYGVADTVQDYQTHLNNVIRVEGYFRNLPSQIRDRFRDPQGMLAFMADPKNMDACVELGLFAGEKKAKGSARKDGEQPKNEPAGATGAKTETAPPK